MILNEDILRILGCYKEIFLRHALLLLLLQQSKQTQQTNQSTQKQNSNKTQAQCKAKMD